MAGGLMIFQAVICHVLMSDGGGGGERERDLQVLLTESIAKECVFPSCDQTISWHSIALSIQQMRLCSTYMHNTFTAY